MKRLLTQKKNNHIDPIPESAALLRFLRYTSYSAVASAFAIFTARVLYQLGYF